jgi:hypothetical protein
MELAIKKSGHIGLLLGPKKIKIRPSKRQDVSSLDRRLRFGGAADVESSNIRVNCIV